MKVGPKKLKVTFFVRVLRDKGKMENGGGEGRVGEPGGVVDELCTRD